jgi:hypothetical protein
MLERRFLPQAVQRTRCLSRSLDTSAPHRMTATAQVSGAWCWQRSYQSHTHGVARCSSPKVGIRPGCMMLGCYRHAAIPSALAALQPLIWKSDARVG